MLGGREDGETGFGLTQQSCLYIFYIFVCIYSLPQYWNKQTLSLSAGLSTRECVQSEWIPFKQQLHPSSFICYLSYILYVPTPDDELGNKNYCI